MVDAPRRGRPPRITESGGLGVLTADAPEITTHVPERADMRAPQREEDPRIRAERRAADLRGQLGDMDDGTDDFYIDPAVIPDGWGYQWKRRAALNLEDPAYQVQLARKGWQPVPASRHPEYMPAGNYKTIERKGMVLMELPQTLIDEARRNELRKAREQVGAKEQQLSGAPQGQFERANKDQPLVKVSKSYEAMPIPD